VDRASTLSALLSLVLLQFTVEWEARSRVSLAMSADVLRFIGDKAVLVRDLASLGGVSKGAVSVSVGYLQRHGSAEVEPAARAWDV